MIASHYIGNEVAANGGGKYEYGSPLSDYVTSIGSPAGAYKGVNNRLYKGQYVLKTKYQNIFGVDFPTSSKWVKVSLKGSKFAGFLGPIGDGVSIAGASWNLAQDPTLEHRLDLTIAIVGIVPIVGDGIAFMYMVAPGMDRMMEERPDIFIQHNINVNNFKCFVGGSKVTMADGTFKSIELVQIGDSVLTYNFENQELEINPVLHVDAPIHHKLVKVVFSNGKEIVSTEDHPYYVKGKGWCSFNPQQTQKNYNIQTGQIEVSDYCLTHKRNKLRKVKILRIEPLEESLKTYNLTIIENSDNYFVNGILVNTESNTEN